MCIDCSPGQIQGPMHTHAEYHHIYREQGEREEEDEVEKEE